MHTVKVLDSYLAYHDSGGDGPVIGFLHGNPTTSYIWRNVTPQFAGLARTLAPDLIGIGASGRPDLAYRFDDHARYLEAFIDALGLDQLILVGYDWGGSLAMDWATRHPGRARAIAISETFLRPLTWAEYPPAVAERFQAIRTPGVGEQLILEENWFIEVALRATNPGISDQDLAEYRSPYPDPASRLPLLQWGRMHPVEGEPADVCARVLAYDAWLAGSGQVPKLLLTIEPNGLGGPQALSWARQHITGLEVESLGRAGHHAPEGQPELLARAVINWLTRHQLVDPPPPVQ